MRGRAGGMEREGGEGQGHGHGQEEVVGVGRRPGARGQGPGVWGLGSGPDVGLGWDGVGSTR